MPKRSTQRRRRNKTDDSGAPSEATVSPSGGGRSQPPPADEKWHAVARRWYESLAASGQSRFYEPSDWATAYVIAESMSRDLGEQVVGTTPTGEILRDEIPLKGASLSAYLKAMSTLLVTEGDRRRVRLELERAGSTDPDEEAAVAKMDEYRKRLG